MFIISIALIVSSKKKGDQKESERYRFSFTIGDLSDESNTDSVTSHKRIPHEVQQFIMTKYPKTMTVILPALKGTYRGSSKVDSRSQADLKHEVNLETLSCSCPWWQERCAHLPDRDIRRVDRHVARLLIRSKAIKEFDEIIQVILGHEDDYRNYEGFGADYLHRMTLYSGMKIVFTFRTSSPWVNVITRRRKKGDTGDYYTGRYSKYGFNLIEERWSYGRTPPGAKLFRNIIKSLFAFKGQPHP
jgi:hypothetical protein